MPFRGGYALAVLSGRTRDVIITSEPYETPSQALAPLGAGNAVLGYHDLASIRWIDGSRVLECRDGVDLRLIKSLPLCEACGELFMASCNFPDSVASVAVLGIRDEPSTSKPMLSAVIVSPATTNSWTVSCPVSFRPDTLSIAGVVNHADRDCRICVGMPAPDETPQSTRVAVYAFSAKDGRLIWVSWGLPGHLGFGTSLSAFPDINGDKVDEVLVGDPASLGLPKEGQRWGREEGSLVVLSGSDGAVLTTRESRLNAGQIGSLVSVRSTGPADPISVLTAGWLKSALGVSSAEVNLMEGADFRSRWAASLGSSRRIVALSRYEDVNADGEADWLVGGGGGNEADTDDRFLTCLSGKDGAVLWGM
jgi:hypothetical protein